MELDLPRDSLSFGMISCLRDGKRSCHTSSSGPGFYFPTSSGSYWRRRVLRWNSSTSSTASMNSRFGKWVVRAASGSTWRYITGFEMAGLIAPPATMANTPRSWRRGYSGGSLPLWGVWRKALPGASTTHRLFKQEPRRRPPNRQSRETSGANRTLLLRLGSIFQLG